MRARLTPRWLRRVSAGLLAAAIAVAATTARAAPPADLAALTAAAEADLLVVTVSLNGVPREGVSYILREGGTLLIDTETLRRLNIRFDSSVATVRDTRVLVPAAAMVGLSWNYDAKRQHLDLMTDPRTMALNDITYQFTSVPQPELPNWGGYLNYALFGTSSSGGDSSLSFADSIGAALTAGVFGPYGVGTIGFLVNSRSASQSAESVVVLDANWRIDNVPRRTTLLIGDTVSTPGWSGRALRFGGVQYSSNLALQPGFVTYPLMAVSGLATVPSTADILMNNVRVAEQQVPPGPFTISNLPTMTGAGELNLVVRDAFGQQQTVTQPFYIAQQLLKPGLTEFSVGAGAARLNYGVENFDYGSTFGYGWVRQGFSTTVTGELRADADEDGASAGVGADLLVGRLGVLSGGFAGSSSPNGSGTRWLVGFDRQTPFVSFGARYMHASPNYREIGNAGPRISDWSTAFLRVSFGRYGSGALGYTGQRYTTTSR